MNVTRSKTFSMLFNSETGLYLEGREGSPDLNMGHTSDTFHEFGTELVFNEKLYRSDKCGTNW